MLHVVKPATWSSPAEPKLALHPRQPRRHLYTTGENLAKARRGTSERAILGAHWVLNSATIIKPTIKSAANLFGVSVPTLTAALDVIKTKTVAVPAIDHIWADMTLIDRAEFVLTHANELFALLDRATKA